MSFQAERESSDAQQALQTFWQKQIQEVRTADSGRSGQLGWGGQYDLFLNSGQSPNDIPTIPEGPFFQMRGLGPMHFKSQELPLARIKKIMKVRTPLIYLEKSKREKNEKGLDWWWCQNDQLRSTTLICKSCSNIHYRGNTKYHIP